MPYADYELPEPAPHAAPESSSERLVVEVFRHAHGARHRLRDDIAIDEDGNVVRRAGGGAFLRDALLIVVIALAVSLLVKTFLLRPFYIPSASMHNTLIEEDRVLVNQLVPQIVPLNHGDVIVFEDPGGWLPEHVPAPKEPLQAAIDGALETVGLKPEDTSNHLVKRVIGLPGDNVVCCNAYGQLMINDVAIREPYIIADDQGRASGEEFNVTVPKDAVWVMGDNRFNSQDSRAHQDSPTGGFVPYSDIVGRAFLINWPLNRMAFLGNYSEVFAAVPSRKQ